MNKRISFFSSYRGISTGALRWPMGDKVPHFSELTLPSDPCFSQNKSHKVTGMKECSFFRYPVISLPRHKKQPGWMFPRGAAPPLIPTSPAGAGLETRTIPFYLWVGFGLENSMLTTKPSMISTTAAHPPSVSQRLMFLERAVSRTKSPICWTVSYWYFK